jgi:hypothetical protein
LKRFGKMGVNVSVGAGVARRATADERGQ